MADILILYAIMGPETTVYVFRSKTMATVEMNWQDRITLNPEILVGKPVIKGTRIAVELIIDLLASEWSEADILRNYPGLTHADILACLRYTSARLQAEKVYPVAA